MRGFSYGGQSCETRGQRTRPNGDVNIEERERESEPFEKDLVCDGLKILWFRDRYIKFSFISNADPFASNVKKIRSYKISFFFRLYDRNIHKTVL